MHLIEKHWQHRKLWLTVFLWPLARVFQGITAVRRWLYKYDVLKTKQLPCLVVVVGNIHVGGVGKTPVVAALVRKLQQKGIRVGVISRGYGRDSSDVVVIDEHTSVTNAGDEPLMLFQQTQAPIAVAASRLDAGKALLKRFPDLQVIISDDGLQHYALKRDMEFVIFPAEDIGKSLDLLPNGPLREPLSRLKTVDGILFSQGCIENVHYAERLYTLIGGWYGFSSLEYGNFYCFNQPIRTATAMEFAGKRCAAVAAIGRPERFFRALRHLGVELSATITLSDHSIISESDWPDAEVIIITEKDAVKLQAPLNRNIWVLPLRAIIQPDLTERIQNQLQLL